jgi:maltose alpha-D-glucosyltransferase / alpha-amylase
VDYVQGDSEAYVLPLAFAEGAEAGRVRENLRRLIIAELTMAGREERRVVYDAVASPAFCRALLGQVWHRRRLTGEQGEITSSRMVVRRQMADWSTLPEPRLGKLEQNNSTVFFGDKLVLKLFRRLEGGSNPELELGGFLTRKEFPHSASLAGALEYSSTEGRRFTLGVVSGFIPNAEDARAYTLDALSRYYDRVITWVAQGREAPAGSEEPAGLLQREIPSAAKESIGTYLESARLLGVRTAELHLALASADSGSDSFRRFLTLWRFISPHPSYTDALAFPALDVFALPHGFEHLIKRAHKHRDSSTGSGYSEAVPQHGFATRVVAHARPCIAALSAYNLLPHMP